ncbi:ENTH/VHS family protein [Raphanus sativus]|uniref:Uncharacterized protein LOC108843461 n=1 Tax=Raphanus sativus TaxID=3726 RepID=A0A6J0MI47_RAPSA|nr:uncharacterized protein LOC108843461 [Raphanus sativus]KAJ4911836.1 ENTH/VHS family protein [Raphanus sativus]
MSSVFSEEILIDKLAKLNSTQQSIETLSHWCIFNRVKAELIVTTWEKQFHSTEMAQKVPLLYLANDILQNSKRQGNEFVDEFWNVLPKAVKDIAVSQGDDRGKGVVSRLVKIWEERKVFGSRSKNLRDAMLGEDCPLPLDVTKKRSRGSKSSKRDSKSSRTKLSSGGVAEKIASAYHLVVAENSNEEAEMSKCKSAVKRIRKMEKDVEEAFSTVKDNPKRKSLAKQLEEEEYLLRQCIEKLKSVQGSRTSLVNQLKDALREQESELKNLEAQIQVAQEQTEEAQNMQKRLKDEDYAPKPTTVAAPGSVSATDNNNNSTKSGQASKMTPASIAAMLTASTSSHMIMQSVLSSFAAEATKTSGLSKSESTVPVSDTNAFAPPYNNPQNQTPTAQGQVQVQGQYHLISNPAAPPPPLPPQFLKQPVMNNPYGFGNIPLMPPGLPPPPPPPHMQQPQIPQSNLAQQQQPQQGTTFQPPGIMYYGPPHHS